MDFLFENEPELWRCIESATFRERPGFTLRSDLKGVRVENRVYSILYTEGHPRYDIPAYVRDAITRFLRGSYPETLI